ncbi:MAG: bifunctional DNA-formamidopyrimidine glycosylase/DNA-(apurinic or apyrimidinic site) lyase [Syntrophales bacterium]|nr:bifunctional DNA-formamidopyrimidine glycosylase/DNA-(apurinic or apyrimidinic site) lyase [Syntrophales bacterium]
MPELPEVESLCRQLRQVVVNRRIVHVEVIDERLGQPPAVTDRFIREVMRRGKGIDLILDGGTILRLHLRMSGRLLWQEDYGLTPTHTRLIITFPEGRLLLIDPRRFATLGVLPPWERRQAPYSPFEELDRHRLARVAKGRRLPVKALLLDQNCLTGLGNIYVSEILFAARVDPRLPANHVTPDQWERIAAAGRTILKAAIRARGSSVSDWRDLFGRKGEYQHRLQVYRRGGQPCFACGTPLVRECIGGRGAYFCPSCQGINGEGQV